MRIRFWYPDNISSRSVYKVVISDTAFYRSTFYSTIKEDES